MKTMRMKLGHWKTDPGKHMTDSSPSNFSVKTMSLAISLNWATSIAIMTYMAPWGTMTLRPGTLDKISVESLALASNWIRVSS